jgi:hypothetical protein
MQRQSGFAGAFRPVNLNNPATRQAANAKRNIKPQRTASISTTFSGSPSFITEPLP